MEPASLEMTDTRRSTNRPGGLVKNQTDVRPVLQGTSGDSRWWSRAGSLRVADNGTLLLTVGESRRDRIPPPSILHLRPSTSNRTSRATAPRRIRRDESSPRGGFSAAAVNGVTAVTAYHERLDRLANRVSGSSGIVASTIVESTSIDAACDRLNVPARAAGLEARPVVSGDRSVTRREVSP